MAAATKKSRYERDSTPRPKNDAYTGLLLISLLAMLTSCVLLAIDWKSFPETAAPKVQVPAAGGTKGLEVPAGEPAPPAPAPMGDGAAPMPMPMGTEPEKK